MTGKRDIVTGVEHKPHSRSIEDLTCDIEMGWDRHLAADLTIPDARVALKELVEQLEATQRENAVLKGEAMKRARLEEQLEAAREALRKIQIVTTARNAREIAGWALVDSRGDVSNPAKERP